VEFLRRRKKANWNWNTVTANTAVSLMDKISNPRLPWDKIDIGVMAHPPPIQLVLENPDMKWLYAGVVRAYPPSQLLALHPRPAWVTQHPYHISDRATLNDVLKHVSKVHVSPYSEKRSVRNLWL
jgi:hypothetical protein